MKASEYIGLAVITQIPLMNFSPLKVGLYYMFFRELKALTSRHQRLYLVAWAPQVPDPVRVYKNNILSSRIQAVTNLTTENAIETQGRRSRAVSTTARSTLPTLEEPPTMERSVFKGSL